MCKWCNDAFSDSDFLLGALSDIEILGLADGFDDARIWVLVEAYVKLREVYMDREMNE